MYKILSITMQPKFMINQKIFAGVFLSVSFLTAVKLFFTKKAMPKQIKLVKEKRLQKKTNNLPREIYNLRWKLVSTKLNKKELMEKLDTIHFLDFEISNNMCKEMESLMKTSKTAYYIFDEENDQISNTCEMIVFRSVKRNYLVCYNISPFFECVKGVIYSENDFWAKFDFVDTLAQKYKQYLVVKLLEKHFEKKQDGKKQKKNLVT